MKYENLAKANELDYQIGELTKKLECLEHAYGIEVKYDWDEHNKGFQAHWVNINDEDDDADSDFICLARDYIAKVKGNIRAKINVLKAEIETL